MGVRGGQTPGGGRSYVGRELAQTSVRSAASLLPGGNVDDPQMVRWLAGALAVAVAQVSCSSAASTTTARTAAAASTAGSRTAAAKERLAHYDDATLAFDYPGSWTPATFTEVSSFSTSIVFMSTDRLRDPCTTSRTATTTTTSCDWPLTKLGNNGVLVQWSEHGFPGWTMSVAKGTETTIAGRPAKVDVQSAEPGNRGASPGP